MSRVHMCVHAHMSACIHTHLQNLTCMHSLRNCPTTLKLCLHPDPPLWNVCSTCHGNL